MMCREEFGEPSQWDTRDVSSGEPAHKYQNLTLMNLMIIFTVAIIWNQTVNLTQIICIIFLLFGGQ